MAYSKVKISIPNVTGNIVITATGAQSTIAYTNLADPTSEDWLNDKKLSISGVVGNSPGAIVTNYIPCTASDIIRIKNLTMTATALPDSNRVVIAFYDSSNAFIAGKKYTEYNVSPYFTDEGNGVYAYDFNGLVSNFSYIRICNAITSGKIASDVIITVNEEIS